MLTLHMVLYILYILHMLVVMVYMLWIDCCLVGLTDSGLYVDILHSLLLVFRESLRYVNVSLTLSLDVTVSILPNIMCTWNHMALGEWVESTGGKRIL